MQRLRPTPARSAVGLAIAVCLLMPGCSGSSSSSGSGQSATANAGTFTMAITADLNGLDPYRSSGLAFGLSVLAYDSLVHQRRDGTFVSGLAEKWAADAHSATFTVRPDVTCSDGTPLTATQVAASISYASNPKNQSVQYGVNTPAAAFTATGDDASRTVKVVMEREPYGFLLNTVGLLPIMCSHGLKDAQLLKKSSDGTGPFVLTEAVPGQSYTLSVRQGYTWGPDGASTAAPGVPARIVLRVVENETTAANLLLSGEIDLAKITGQDDQRLAARGIKRLDWKLGGAWLSFNQRAARVTADKRLRQSMVQALELGEIVKVSTGGTGTAATGLLALEPKGCSGDTVTGALPAHDVAAAETLLDKAGWIKGADGVRRQNGKPLSIDLHYATYISSLDKPTAELIAQRWRAIGVDVRLTPDGTGQAIEVLYKTSNFDVYLIGYQFQLPSQMVPYLSGPVPPQGKNAAGIHNKQYESLVTKAGAMMPPEACGSWNEAERAITRNLDIAPISSRVDHWYLRAGQAEIQRYDAPVPTSLRVAG